MNINELHLPLCIYITKTQRFSYCWRSMQYNQMKTVNSRGLSVLRTTNVFKIKNIRQREGPAVRCRFNKIIAYML